MNMSMKSKRPVLAVTVVAAAIALPALTSAALHFKLDRSSPAADAEIETTDAVELWFSQVPLADSTSIRLLYVEGELVETSDVEQGAEDGKHQLVRIAQPLQTGAYTVAWRSMAADGHVVRGDFGFTVAPPTRD